MTNRDRIVDLLVLDGNFLSNREIATRLELPEPSVRRTTRELEIDGVLCYDLDSPIRVWQLSPSADGTDAAIAADEAAGN